ncbi:MAG TPA: hypothetical protein VNO52_18135 [Methylomirabilota bacterium]|nr:hypothetical protein [Methylomirabilota bacterium]
MTPRHELQDLYLQWRRWTVLETEAIGTADWVRVEECQAAKRDLQPRITRAAEQARLDSGAACAQDGQESRVRVLLNELIDLERRNLDLLARLRDRATAELDRLGQAGRNLRRVHRSYVPDLGRVAHWQSFS